MNNIQKELLATNAVNELERNCRVVNVRGRDLFPQRAPASQFVQRYQPPKELIPWLPANVIHGWINGQ